MGNISKAPISNFEWIEETSQFNEDFIKNYNEESDEGYFLEFDVQYLKKLHGLYNNLLFLPERTKTGKQKSLLLIYMIKMYMSLL